MSAPGKGPLRIAIEDFLTGFGFGDKFKGWIKSLLETWELEAIDAYDEMLTIFKIKDGIPEQLRPDTLRQLMKHQIALAAVFIPVIYSIVQQLIPIITAPFFRPLGYLGEALAHTKHPDAPTLLQMIQRRPDLSDKLKSLIGGTGYDQASIDGFTTLVQQLLTAQDYERLKLRGKLTDEQTHDALKRAGYADSDIDGMNELIKQIPGPSDLISMAVREAWNDEVSSRFQYDSGLDQIPQFAEWMQKQGFDPDWAKRYWRSHWQLIGVNQAYEMLHRLRSGELQFTTADMEMLLKTADIPEFFRKRLIAISYNPFTRVDIRRMFGANVLTADEVKQAYLDIGYDDEHAIKLTAFTTNVEKAEERGLTREAIQGAYKRGIYDRPAALAAIQAIGLSAEDADFWLDLTDYDTEAKNTDEKLAAIQLKYESGILNESTVNDALGPLNLPSERMLSMLEVWTIRRNNKVALPSRSELDDMRRRGIIDTVIYKDYLKRDGYPADVIEWFTKRIDEIIVQDTLSETLSAQSEQDRLSHSEKATKYQKDRADLDVQIAQVKAAIADIQLALHDISDASTMDALARQVLEYKNLIVHLNLSKTELKLNLIAPTGGTV